MWTNDNTFTVDVDGHGTQTFEVSSVADKINAIKSAAQSAGWKNFKVYNSGVEIGARDITEDITSVRIGPYNKAA